MEVQEPLRHRYVMKANSKCTALSTLAFVKIMRHYVWQCLEEWSKCWICWRIFWSFLFGTAALSYALFSYIIQEGVFHVVDNVNMFLLMENKTISCISSIVCQLNTVLNLMYIWWHGLHFLFWRRCCSCAMRLFLFVLPLVFLFVVLHDVIRTWKLSLAGLQ